MAKAPAFNVMLYSPKNASVRARLKDGITYRSVACFKDVCVMRRPGGCTKLPMAKRPPLGEMNADSIKGYPYVAGVD
jgi:hypothetical protein